MMSLGIIVMVTVIGGVFFIVHSIGNKYKANLENQSNAALEASFDQEKYDMRRIKIELENGQTIEILQNGTIVSTEDSQSQKAVLGFSKLKSLLSTYTEEQLKNLTSTGQSGTIVTIETKSGNTYTFIVDDNDPDHPLNELIDEVEDTSESTFNPPTPIPTPTSTPTPNSGTPTPEPSISTTPTPSANPSLSPGTTPTPMPLPTPVEPFNCSDYTLLKNTIISNIVCEPAP